MSQVAPRGPKTASAGDKADIGAATARLFFEMSTTMTDADLRQAVATMNERMALKRQYETVLIPDLEEEFRPLCDAWHARDIS